MPTQEPILLNRSSIRTNGGTQPRFQLSEEQIGAYAEAMKDGAEFPALECAYDGSAYWLWDGFTRLSAGDRIGKTTWKVHVTQGSREDAVWLSYGANGTHGLPRSKEETLRAIESALVHPKGKGMSDEAIAQHTQTTRGQVRYARDKMRKDPESHYTEPETRTGTDGKEYKQSQPSSRPAGSKASQPPSPAAPPPLKDAAGRTIHDLDYYNLATARDILSETRNGIIRAKQAWEEISKEIDKNPKAAAFAKHPFYKSIFKLMKSLPDTILDLGKYFPHTACVYCKGEGPCEACGESRWITEQQFEDAPEAVRKPNGPTFKSFQKKAA